MFIEASETLQLNGVLPIGKVEPEGGTQAGVPTPGQLSDTTGLSGTDAPAGLVHSTTGDGHEMFGGCSSTTITSALHEALWPFWSVMVSVTGSVPLLLWPWRRLAQGEGVAVGIGRAVVN